ncbi:uncharacterized protein BJX67DRAFT_353060 [Aspergillus lucknowensis]|uniref:Uncharacterized protein n=1 Tax=Aspergillus lucknowensis TaxID=176173 RepID=A0ABR4LSB6_9EURO
MCEGSSTGNTMTMTAVCGSAAFHRICLAGQWMGCHCLHPQQEIHPKRSACLRAPPRIARGRLEGQQSESARHLGGLREMAGARSPRAMLWASLS